MRSFAPNGNNAGLQPQHPERQINVGKGPVSPAH